MIPILFKHDPERVIGRVTSRETGLSFEFTDNVVVTQDQFFDLFGSCGAVFTSMEMTNDNMMMIKAGTILEFSLEDVSIRAVLVEALNRIAAWKEGENVTGSFDEPHAARIAREALARIKPKGKR